MRKGVTFSFLLHAGILTCIVTGPLVRVNKPEPVYFVDLMSIPSPASTGPESVSGSEIKEREFLPVDNSAAYSAEKPVPHPENTSKEIQKGFSPEEYLGNIRNKLSQVEKTGEPSSMQGNRPLKLYASVPGQDVLQQTYKGTGVSIPSASGQGLPGDYFNRVKAVIQKNWKIPPGEIFSLYSIVSFRLNPDGTYSNVILEESSGRGNFDENSVSAVKKVSKFPAFPASLKQDVQEIIIKFNAQGVE